MTRSELSLTASQRRTMSIKRELSITVFAPINQVSRRRGLEGDRRDVHAIQTRYFFKFKLIYIAP